MRLGEFMTEVGSKEDTALGGAVLTLGGVAPAAVVLGGRPATAGLPGNLCEQVHAYIREVLGALPPRPAAPTRLRCQATLLHPTASCTNPDVGLASSAESRP